MNKTYLFAGILFVVIVGAALYWRGQSGEAQKNSPPTPMTQEGRPSAIESSTTPENEPTNTPMKTKGYSAAPTMTIDTNKTYVATLATDKGSMEVQLFAKETPTTVNNFVFLAREGFYTSTIFHRIISGFMIQGGDPLGNGTGGPGYKFADEPITRNYSRGTIAMANSGPNTNGSQFFIMHATYPLPKNYVIFGEIDASDSASLATLDAIASSPTTDSGMGERSKPVTPPVIQSITIEEK